MGEGVVGVSPEERQKHTGNTFRFCTKTASVMLEFKPEYIGLCRSNLGTGTVMTTQFSLMKKKYT